MNGRDAGVDYQSKDRAAPAQSRSGTRVRRGTFRGRCGQGLRPGGTSISPLTPIQIARLICNIADAAGLIRIERSSLCGCVLATPVLAANAEDVLRREMEVNVFGMLAMSRAFAPVLARNGGGVLVNMLSVVSWYVYPFNSTYCATKHAALAVTDGLRIQLRAQGTMVIGVYAGLIDTEMGATLSSGPKTSPRQVAEKTMQGIRFGIEHVVADDSAMSLWQATREDLVRKHADMQTRWDQHVAATRVQI